MNTLEIKSCLRQDASPYFVGVYPRDKLPTLKSLPAVVIANTDTSKGPGEHWITMYIPLDGEAMYFDSYGLPPQQKVFERYMGKSYTSNNIQLQSIYSSACGQYAVYSAVKMCRGWNMKQIQSEFDRRNLVENDTAVTDWVNKSFNMKTDTYDDEFLLKQICNVMKNVFIQ